MNNTNNEEGFYFSHPPQKSYGKSTGVHATVHRKFRRRKHGVLRNKILQNKNNEAVARFVSEGNPNVQEFSEQEATQPPLRASPLPNDDMGKEPQGGA